jgi:hypothetical protein
VKLLSCNYKNNDLGGMVEKILIIGNTTPILLCQTNLAKNFPARLMVTIQPNRLKLAVENINRTNPTEKNINHLKNNKTKKLKHKKNFIKLQYTNK